MRAPQPPAEDENATTLTVTIDDRERASGLAEELCRRWPRVAVGRLAVGDIEIGPRILVERKTVVDFVASLADGRLFNQAYALSRASWRPLLVVEGRDGGPLTRLSPTALRGVLLTITAGIRVPLLRTDDVAETALLLAQLARQEERRTARWRQQESDDRGPGSGTPRSGARPPPPGRVAANLLGAIPGVGDLRARTLLDRFGSVAGVGGAEEADLREAPGIGRVTARRVRRALRGEEGGDAVREAAPAYCWIGRGGVDAICRRVTYWRG